MFRAIRSVFSARSNSGLGYWGPKYFGKLLPLITAGVLMSGGSAMAAPKAPLKAQPAYRPTVQLAQLPTEAEPRIPTVSGALADGVYFFGAAPERDQLGVEYMVFEVDNAQVVGAFYLPSSNFDCFHGEAGPDVLALNITDSYDQAVHSYDLAMESVPAAVAGGGAGAFAPVGFYSLGQTSDLEAELLTTCQANYADAI
ncbi:MAG: hypothetical protein AAFU71_17110 [Cyanobacteria bacterium J06632_22]